MIGFAEVKEHIPDPPTDAINQFRVIVRGQLEVHAPKDALAGGGEEFLGWLEIYTQVRVEALMHSFDKVTALIEEDAGSQ
jgi:hypothetical protein